MANLQIQPCSCDASLLHQSTADSISKFWPSVKCSGASVSSANVTKFKLSDFNLYSHVSIGLSGRGEEVLYEGIVRNPSSPFNGKRVVLRQLTDQRRSRQAVKIISKLPVCQSYPTRVHGYILSSLGVDKESLTLVHGI